MPLAKYTNREKSKGEVVLRTPPGNPASYPVPRRYVLVTPARIFKLQPFRNVKGDFCRTPSIGFNGHRYSNLFDGGSSSPSRPLLTSILLLCSLISSLSLSFRPRSPRNENRYARNRCELQGFDRGAGRKKRICISLFFIFLRPWSRYSRGSRTEATPTDARITVRHRRLRPRYFGRHFLRGEVYISRKDWCHITTSYDAHKSSETVTPMRVPIFY